MHLVAALDKVDGLRCILGLAETVVTGCDADALRAGFVSGLANMHNARRGRFLIEFRV